MSRDADAFERGVTALHRRERTVDELSTWLSERGFSEAEVEDAITRLIEVGELDDERFARRFAEDKRELRGWGAERIRAALAERGVDPDLVEGALAEESHADQVERAAKLLADRGPAPATDQKRARALAFLCRRGYDYEIAYEAVRRSERRAA